VAQSRGSGGQGTSGPLTDPCRAGSFLNSADRVSLRRISDLNRRSHHLPQSAGLILLPAGPIGAITQQTVLEYEQHASACRQIAAETKNPQFKKQLEDMAEVWDRLAAQRRQGIVENAPNP
jgi:hypothetical protein